MLFENKKCEKCGSNYDVALSTCPACQAHNPEVEKRKISQGVVWIPFWKQILLFAMGFIVLHILSIGLTYFLAAIKVTDEVVIHLLLNMTCYNLVFFMMIALLIGDYPKFKKSFNSYIPYVIGFGAGVILIMFSLTYNFIINICQLGTTNENQSIANSMIGNYPIISFFVIGFLGPIVEEMTYRLGMFSFLRRINKWVAYLVTILFFTLIHFSFNPDTIVNELINLPNYLFAGFVFCFIYDKWGFGCSLTAHIINNSTSVLLAILSILLKRLSS